MPILYAGTTMPISVAAGQTLVLKELAGTATVTGSTASREDASTSIGAGFVVYGPQPTASTVSLTTTGICEWSLVNGDATPVRDAFSVTPYGTIYPASLQVLANSGVRKSSISSRPSLAWSQLVSLRAAIIGNGGTVDERDLLALRGPLDTLIKTPGLWAKLQELWIPVGNGYLSALCKIKGATTQVMTGNNIVDGDFTRWLGVTGNGTNKSINTGFTPTGLTGNWGCCVYPTGPTAPQVNQVLCGDGTNTYVGFGAVGSGGSVKIDGSASLVAPVVQRLMATQNSGAEQSAWYGGLKQNFANGTAATQTGQLRLLNHGTGAFWAATSVGGYAAWSGIMTSAQLQALSVFFDAASYALGRLSIMSAINFCGDSNTSGQGVTSGQRWPALLAAKLGVTEINNGLAGVPMSGASGFVTGNKGQRSSNSGVYLTVMQGTNDDRQGATAENFAADYETWLNYQFSIGWNPASIIVIAPPAATAAGSSRARLIQFGAIARGLAEKYGCLFIDAFAATDGHPEYLQGDELHLSVAGHVALGDLVYGAILADTPVAALWS